MCNGIPVHVRTLYSVHYMVYHVHCTLYSVYRHVSLKSSSDISVETVANILINKSIVVQILRTT